LFGLQSLSLRVHDIETSLVEVRKGVIDGVYLCVFDAGCAVAFKTDSEFDYKSYTSHDLDAVE